MKMMKTTLFAIAAMAAVSCVKEQIADNSAIVNPNLVECTFYAGTETSETKAAFSEDAYPQIEWQGNEEISVLGTNTANQKFSTSSTGTTAEFNGVADLTDEVLYAVYPYDAAVELTADGKLSKVTVPAVQTATAGSFDPKAYLAVAKSTDKEHFAFKAVGGFVKFQLEDAANVKSVTMVSNAGNNMACTATVTFNNNGSISHGSPYDDGTASDNVKLVGTFETGKDYFMIVRPQPYTGGITLYIEYTDGTVLSRKGESALFESGKGRNYIRNLGTLKKSDFTQVNDLYSLYNRGYDIMIAGKAINKDKYAATHIQVDSESKTIAKAGGVYFVDSDTELTLTAETYNNLYIIGNNPLEKTVVNITGTVKWATNNTLGFKNIDLKEGTGLNSQLFQAVNGGSVLIDNCKLNPNNYTIIYSYQTALQEVRIHNSDILVSKDNTPAIIGAGSGRTITVSTFELHNNIVYSAEGDKFGFRISDHTGISATTLSLENNTFANVYNYNVAADSENKGYYILSNNNKGYLNMGQVSSYNLKDNLFYTPNYDTYKNTGTNPKGETTHLSATTVILSPAATETNASNNMHLKTENNDRLKVCTNGTALSRSSKEADIVSNVDLANGIIVSKGTYGATR